MEAEQVLIRMNRDYWISEWMGKNVQPSDGIHIHKDEILIAHHESVKFGYEGKPGDVYEIRGVWVEPTAFEIIG